MALQHIVLAATDSDLTSRIAACAIGEPNFPPDTDPVTWAAEHRWWFASRPGWGDKFDSAIQTGIGRPGWEGSVVSDADILAAVQAKLAETPA